MKFKIVKVKGKTCEEVLVARSERWNGDLERVVQKVGLSAWHENSDGDTDFQYEELDFGESHTLADRFVADFSESSPTEFANQHTF